MELKVSSGLKAAMVFSLLTAINEQMLPMLNRSKCDHGQLDLKW